MSAVVLGCVDDPNGRSGFPERLAEPVIGAVVHPLATGRFGEELVGGPLFDPEQLARRKQAVKDLLHAGIVADEAVRIDKERR